MRYIIRYDKSTDESKWRANNAHPLKDKTIGLQQFYTGITYAILSNSDSLFIGVSKCSKKDNFDKKIARQIATGRAESGIKIKNENRLVTFRGSNIIMTRSSWDLLGSPASLVFLPETLLKMIEDIERTK